MSAVKGTNYTKAYSPTPRTLLGPEYGGKVRVIQDSYEAASLAAGSTIAVGKIPKGAVYVGGWVIADDLSSAGTLSLGDSGSATRFMAATVFTTAGQAKAAQAIDGIGYAFTADTEIILTTGVEEMTGTIKTVLLYAENN